MLEDIAKEILSALILMSKDKKRGVNYIEFVKQGNMIGATELINKGYAEKNMWDNPDYASKNHYLLTEKGQCYLEKVLRVIQREF